MSEQPSSLLVWGEMPLQVFYQGIDKVSKAVENRTSSGDEPRDDPDGEAKTEGAEGGVVDGEGDVSAEAIDDPPPKDDDEQDEDAGQSESKEMTDEELALRCGRSTATLHNIIPLA